MHLPRPLPGYVPADWLSERLDNYHAQMAAKEAAGESLVAGPIVATILRERDHPAIRLMVGDCEIVVQATPKGRRVFVSIDDGSGNVQTTRRHKDGRWS